MKKVMLKTSYKTISFIVPTVGRESLKSTLASIDAWPGDEVLAIQHNPPSGYYGYAERQEGTDRAKCDYLAYLDDDDRYVPGHREIMDQATRENPNNYPILFKMQYPSGRVLPKVPDMYCGNVGTPMILVPNIKEKLSKWKPERIHDFRFIDNWKWPRRQIIWRPEIIALLGHEDSVHLDWMRRYGKLTEVRKEEVGDEKFRLSHG